MRDSGVLMSTINRTSRTRRLVLLTTGCDRSSLPKALKLYSESHFNLSPIAVFEVS